MKNIFKSAFILMSLTIAMACGRDYETVDAAFNDTLEINGVPNKVLEDKDPANLVDTKTNAKTGEQANTELKGRSSNADSSGKK